MCSSETAFAYTEIEGFVHSTLKAFCTVEIVVCVLFTSDFCVYFKLFRL